MRSSLSWPRSFVLSALGTILSFVLWNWRGCWLFRNDLRNLWDFSYLFAWFLLLFALRTRWRLVLLAVTIPLALQYFGFHGLAEENAGPEAAAVDALRQLHSALENYRAEHPRSDYPVALPATTLSPAAQKFYRYELIPRRSNNGQIVGYLIQATPARRDCEFHRSFTITDDAKLYWTYDPRPATPSDMLLPN